MRTKSEVRADLKEARSEVEIAQRRVDELRKELEGIRKLSDKESLLQSLSPLGVAMQNSSWARSSLGHYSKAWNGFNGKYEKPTKQLRMTISDNNNYLSSSLTLFELNKWSLNFRIENYGTPYRKPKTFTGTEADAKKWAEKLLTERLLSMKKRLQKQLSEV